MKIYCTVTLPLSQESFEFDTAVDPDLPWHDFIKAINLHSRLDKEYPDWQGYDLDIDEADIILPKMFGKLETPVEEESTEE